MAWEIRFHPAFVPEFDDLATGVQDALLERAKWLEAFGPKLGRPHADALKGSKHANMKELRFSSDGGVWRVAFAFDPERRGVLLVAGDKSGTGKTAFYKGLIKRADERYDDHLTQQKRKRVKGCEDQKEKCQFGADFGQRHG
ncbi:MAG TPA: addiction module toxin RelE, partial [Alphaproteobacteria bacterium]|nr:addiction module toxin RelE [Alphaproteobacteria bacterium]